jgi:hypothetical protein
MPETISSFPVWGAIGIALIVVVTIAAISWSIARQKTEAKKQRLSNLGYTPILPPPPGLVERLTALNQGRHVRKLKLQNVFQRAITGGQLYWFDMIIDKGSEDDNSPVTDLLGVVSPGLTMPHFLLIPMMAQLGRSDAGGALANLVAQAANKLLSWSTGGLKRVSFADQPAFEQHYSVFGQAEAEVRGFLTDNRLNYLLGLEYHYTVEAGRDIFTLKYDAHFNNKKAQPDTEIMAADAQKILAWFRAEENQF